MQPHLNSAAWAPGLATCSALQGRDTSLRRGRRLPLIGKKVVRTFHTNASEHRIGSQSTPCSSCALLQVGEITLPAHAAAVLASTEAIAGYAGRAERLVR